MRYGRPICASTVSECEPMTHFRSGEPARYPTLISHRPQTPDRTLNDHRRHSTPQHHAHILYPNPASTFESQSRVNSASTFCYSELKMRPDSIKARCRSAGRVTTGLLLSFLALSTPAAAIWNGAPAQEDLTPKHDRLPPIEPLFPGIDDPGDLASAERFVCCPA